MNLKRNLFNCPWLILTGLETQIACVTSIWPLFMTNHSRYVNGVTIEAAEGNIKICEIIMSHRRNNGLYYVGSSLEKIKKLFVCG